MPITALRDNPISRFPSRSILESDGIWWIAKTKPQQEKSLAFELLENRIEYYLPLYTKTAKRNDGKTRKSLLVLFPSYVPFISESPFSLLNKKQIATIIPIKAQDKFKAQLNQVYMAIEANVIIKPAITSFEVSDTVKITAGPLNGITGNVIRIPDEASLLLSVEGMGCVSVLVRREQIEKTATR